jgi:hypothetical protein
MMTRIRHAVERLTSATYRVRPRPDDAQAEGDRRGGMKAASLLLARGAMSQGRPDDVRETSSNSRGLVQAEITSGHVFMLDKPVPTTPVRLSRWAMFLEYLKALYR